MASKQPNSFSGDKFPAIYEGTTQTVAVSSASAPTTNAFKKGVSIVRVFVTKAAFVTVGASPTADNTKIYLPDNGEIYLGVNPDGTDKIAAIRSSADGTMYVTEGAPT